MTIREATTLAKKMLEKYNELSYRSVSVNKRKRSFGVCNYSKRQIELSEYLVPSMTNEGIIDTIIHEIAHALTQGHNHDSVWKAKFIELGGSGDRCSGSEKFKDGEKGQLVVHEKLAKYTLTCPICGAKYFKHRKPVRMSSCGKHNTRGFDPTYKLILTQNY